MTFTATGEPSNIPPRVHLELDTAVSGATFNTLTVSRDGTPIRLQPPTGTQATETYDYEAPFGQLVQYVASGTYLPFLAPDWTENWASLAAWTGSGWSLGPGSTVTSSTNAAMITRSASGTIQRVEVTDPSNTGVILWTAADELVLAVASGDVLSPVTALSAADYVTTPNVGSYTITLLDGAVTVSAADSSWTLEGAALPGSPTKVSVYSYGGVFAETSSFSTTGNADRIAVASGGNIYALDIAAKLVRKFNSSGVFQTSWSTTNTPSGIALDSSENVYVTDRTSSLVRKYNSSGTAGITWSTTSTPYNIGIDGSDNVYVLTSSSVRKYSTTGTVGITWSVDSDFVDMAVAPNGSVYILVHDSIAYVARDVVEKYTSAGVAGTPAFFAAPNSPNSTIAASDAHVYEVDGTTATQYSSSGVAGVGTTINPHIIGGAFETPAGTLLLGDTTAKTIRKFTTNSASVDVIEVTLEVTPVAYYEIASVTLSIGEAWLIHPSQPELSVSIDGGTWRDVGLNVDIASAQQTAAKSAVTLHQPVGRTRTVAIAHGSRLDEEWALVLFAPTLADRDDVRAIIRDQTPLLLRSPASFGWDLADGYYAIGDVPFDRVAPALPQPYRRITLPLTPSDPPVVHVATDRSWDDVVEQNTTWADVVLAYPSWTDLLVGSS